MKMFTYPKFDVPVEIGVDVTALRWPRRDEGEDDSGLGGNRHYADLRFVSWSEVERVANLETILIARVEGSGDPEAELEEIEEELYESDDNLLGLDLGVAASVASLSAAGCIPCSSCNGGAFGQRHQELYPLVVFFTKAGAIALITESATDADIGLVNGPDGCVVAYSDDVRKMQTFAGMLLSRRDSFKGLRAKSRAQITPKTTPQLDLEM